MQKMLLVSILNFLLVFLNEAGAYASKALVAVAEGNVYLREGALEYSHPKIGDLVPVNDFGQYRGTAPKIATFHYNPEKSKLLSSLDQVPENGIIETEAEGFCKILFADEELVLDIGTDSIVQITENHIKILKGNFKVTSAQMPPKSDKMVLLLPNAELRMKGTQLLVWVDLPDAVPQNPDVANRSPRQFFEKSLSSLYYSTKTELVILHGLVVADTYQLNLQGLVYGQQNMLRPSSLFTVEGPHGITEHKFIKNVSQVDLKKYVKKFSPLVNVYATVAGLKPWPWMLPGTGVDFRRPSNAMAVRENFLMPTNFEIDRSAVWSSFAESLPLTTNSSLPLVPSLYKK